MNIPPNKIGFDFDGVIADIGEAFIRLACSDYGYCSFSLNDITDFNVEKCIDIPESIVNSIFSAILDDSLETGLRPISGAVNILERLAKEARITIITARSNGEPVSDWLNHYLSSATCSQIQLIAMSDHDQKVHYIQDEGLRYFIDDRGETCRQIEAAQLTPLLFDQPWNRTCSAGVRVTGWNDLNRFIRFR